MHKIHGIYISEKSWNTKLNGWRKKGNWNFTRFGGMGRVFDGGDENDSKRSLKWRVQKDWMEDR